MLSAVALNRIYQYHWFSQLCGTTNIASPSRAHRHFGESSHACPTLPWHYFIFDGDYRLLPVSPTILASVWHSTVPSCTVSGVASGIASCHGDGFVASKEVVFRLLPTHRCGFDLCSPAPHVYLNMRILIGRYLRSDSKLCVASATFVIRTTLGY